VSGPKQDDESSGPFNNPFGSLGSLRDQLPASPTKTPAKAVARAPARAVVRLERKGHGGKEVTCVTHLELRPKQLEEWIKSLKSELGCGGRVDGDTLVLQGDQRERLRAALTARGVGKVTIG
jgi:translation initiation factor 1